MPITQKKRKFDLSRYLQTASAPKTNSEQRTKREYTDNDN
jgi:hypothetical protein